MVTPVWTHFELAKAALENGKHVFVEKPFTSTAAQAEELIELADRKNLTIMVDHTFLFSGPVMKIRELVDSGALGALYYFDSTRVNLGLFQHDVNVVWDLAPHDLSIMDHIIRAKPEAVVATGGKHLNGLADVAFITIYFPGNVIAHVNVNWLSPVKVRTTLIGGEQKMLVWNDLEADEKIKVYDKGVKITNREGRARAPRQLPLGRRLGATSRADRSPEGRARVLHRLHRERPDAHQRRRGRPADRQTARSGRSVAERARQSCLPLTATSNVTPPVPGRSRSWISSRRTWNSKPELVSVFRRALRTAGFVGGPMVEEFEREFADFCDVRHAVGVASGTDALRFALMAAGVQPGDTVVTVPNTFIATTEAISQAGAQAGFRRRRRTHLHDGSRRSCAAYLETNCMRDAEGRRRAAGAPAAR